MKGDKQHGPAIDDVRATALRFPTPGKESDGTLEWDGTTVVVVEVTAAGVTGLGYTYADASARVVVESLLAPKLLGEDALMTPALHATMRAAVRNNGPVGVCAMAISAVDVALWDLHARLLDVPLLALFGRARRRIDAYGSNGFTSASIDELAAHMQAYAKDGFFAAKMKVGREPDHDLARVRAARRAMGPGTKLFVDANGAYDAKEALAFAARFATLGVTWFEEPVAYEDVDGTKLVRERAPAKLEIAGGEYAWGPLEARRVLEARAVDVLQADITRCGGFTGFLAIDALCHAFAVPLSTHCAPALHVHAACAAPSVRHLEYFADHVRIEAQLFDGVVKPERGALAPDLAAPGHALTLRRDVAARHDLARTSASAKAGEAR